MVQSRQTGRITTIYRQCLIAILQDSRHMTTAFPGQAIVYKRQLPHSLLPVESSCLNSNKVTVQLIQLCCVSLNGANITRVSTEIDIDKIYLTGCDEMLGDV